MVRDFFFIACNPLPASVPSLARCRVLTTTDQTCSTTLPLLGLLKASSEESDEMGPLPLTHRVSAHVLGWSSAVSQRRSSVQDARRVVDVYFVMVFVSDCLDIWTWESYLKHFLNVSLTQAYLTVLRILQQTLLFFWKLTYVKMGSTWR